jgi:hypothetical protein
MGDDERLTTPDDPEFAGAQFISQEAMIQYKVAHFELHGFTWTWAMWSSDKDDHDHCLICHDAAFSHEYDGDLREGWRSVEPSWESPGWLCQDCFDRFRDHFGWRVAE